MSIPYFRNSATGTVRLSNDLFKLINNRQGSDVQFIVGGSTNRDITSPTGETIIDASTAVTIYAHSAILSCRSRHFAEMFQKEVEWRKRTGGVIYIPHISPIVFKNIIEYIYTGSVGIKMENLLELVAATEQMEIEELSIICQAMVIHVLEQAFSDEIDSRSESTNTNAETESSCESYSLEHDRLPSTVAIREMLIPALELAHRLRLQEFFQDLSDWTNDNMESILASPEIRTLFTKTIPTRIFAHIVLLKYNAIFKMNNLSIPNSLKADIVLELLRLSENEDVIATSRLGLCWQHGFGVEKDYSKAAEYFITAAEAGNADAQSSLGFFYHKGYGVNKDYTKAVELYTRATEAGNIFATNNLALCYEQGHGVTKNYTKAAELYTKAAEAGNLNAQNNLGLCYEHGQGVTKNYEKAIELYRIAAESGNVIALNNLGLCYEHGRGVVKSYIKAVELYKIAADSGNTDAQNNLASCYRHGRGVTKDFVRAIQLYTKAAEAGHEMAQQSLGKLRKRLS